MSKEKLAIIIDGGLGRTICAIPALIELNKTYELIVLAGGWIDAYTGSNLNVLPLGLPNIDNKLQGFKIIKPEPYWELGYRIGELNLVEAFYVSLGLKLPKDVTPFKTDTRHTGTKINSPKPIMIVQPFGSGGQVDPRSMTNKEFAEVVQKHIQSHTVVVVGTQDELQVPEDVLHVKESTEAQFIQYIQNADEFIGCDSSGLHIAAAAGIKHTAYLSITSGIKYYENTDKKVRVNYEGMRVNPRL